MRFYLGVHMPRWLEEADVPLFVSRTRFLRDEGRLRDRLPRAAGPWALDSGGFTELSRNGTWTVDEARYVADVRRIEAEVGSLEWAAPMDWMCEPEVIAGDSERGWPGTGLPVAEHQRRTVENFVRLRAELGSLVIPVLQGWEPDDYLRCASLYDEAGVELERERLVGVGSVCRRQGTREAAIVFRRLAELGLCCHGFGVKTTGLKKFADALASSDSMAWSFAARMEQRGRLRRADRLGLTDDHPERFSECGRRSCANCLHRALEWRETILRDLDGLGQQQRLTV